MRKLFWACALSLIVTAMWASSSPRAEILDRIVATVNGDIITMKELDGRVKPLIRLRKARNQAEVNQLRRTILDIMIDQLLILQEAERLKIIITDGEVDQAIERIKASKNVTQEQLVASFAKQGISMDTFREDVRFDLIREMVMHSEVLSRIVVPAREVDAYFSDHKDEFDIKPKVHLKNILLAVPSEAPASQVRKKMDLAEKVLAEIQGGMKFTEAASKYSDASNAAEGGDLGPINWSDLESGIREALKDLKKGQVSRPIRMGGGIQIFQVVDRIEVDKEEMARVKEKIRGLLAQRQAEGKIKEWLRKLRESAIIKVNF